MNKILAVLLVLCATVARGQGLLLELETTTTISGGDFAPLWLSSNRHGLSSVEKAWNYERVALHGDIFHNKEWSMTYGADVAAMFGGERAVAVTEAYVEAAWNKIFLIIGSKKQPLMLKNERLTSGGLSYGINARPIPQMRVGFDYFSIPGTKGWWQWKGHMAYGWMADGHWMKNWSSPNAKRTENTLYHEKALYWKFGNEKVFPLDFQIGLQWATEFGGKAYNFTGRGFTQESTASGVALNSGLRAFWNAFVSGGSDLTDGRVKNSEGNHLGSWNVALTYRPGDWMLRAYGERYFEDISQLGVLYGISDHLIGVEIGLPKNPFVSTVVVEHINTRNQSGAVYHDWSSYIPDKMNGRDNYYNHNIYNGWQHFGMSIGSPLLTSPLYNSNLGKEGMTECYNNRIYAWHIALSGNPTSETDWRLLMSFSRNWGTYALPFYDPQNQSYMMLEAGYAPHKLKGWNFRAAVGMDHGDMLGNNTGAQLTVAKTLNLK